MLISIVYDYLLATWLLYCQSINIFSNYYIINLIRALQFNQAHACALRLGSTRPFGLSMPCAFTNIEHSIWKPFLPPDLTNQLQILEPIQFPLSQQTLKSKTLKPKSSTKHVSKSVQHQQSKSFSDK